MRFARIVSVVALLLAALAAAAAASLPFGPVAAPSLIAPIPDATAYEGGLRFAWTAAPGTSRQVLVLSTRPFDARSWTRVEPGTDLTVIESARPLVALAEAKLTLVADTRLYWAAGSARGPKDDLRFSETRSVMVLRKFANRVQPTPYISASPIGRAVDRVDGEPDHIRLEAGYDFDPAQGEPVMAATERFDAVAGAAAGAWLMYYGDADPARTREAILAAGGRVVAYIPDHTFLVQYPNGAPPVVDGVRWTGVFQPAYKLSPALDRQSSLPVTMTVLAFPDADVAALNTQLVNAGAQVLARSDNGINKIFRISAPGAALDPLARIQGVAWIEPYVRPVADNANVEWIDQTFSTNNRRLWDLGLHGEGQIIHHSDSGIDISHEMFNDPAVPIATFGDYPTHRKVVRYEKGSSDPNVVFGDHVGASFHGSHTSGTAAGNDLTVPLAGFDGVAKAAKIWHSDLSGPALGTGISPPLDLNDLFQPSYTGNAAGAARISTNSWGAPVGGLYDVEAFQVDQFVWSHPDYLICFANGNSGSSFSVGSPATAKDLIGVGGTLNGSIANARTIYSSTSRGPTQDARRKPMICSPASGVTSARNGPATYQTLGGTSMATPGTAGTAALLRQYCKEGWYPTGTQVPANGFSPSAALLKAMLLNSGINDITGFIAPDNNVGYGRICADTVLYFAGDTKRLLLVDQTEGLGHGQMIEYQVNVVDAQSALEVALCWSDYPGNPVGGVQLVNNLNLTVTNGVETYKGNVYLNGFGNPNTGNYDSRNVEEAVLVKIPSVGLWTIRVEGFNVPIGPQPFALAITGGVGVSAGSLALDRPSYGSSGSVEVQVTDTDAPGSINVTLSSNSEPAGETLNIVGSNGLYQGTLPISPVKGTAGNGTLFVSHGDVITATYNDASPVATIVAHANVSFNPPVITGVLATGTGGGATIRWTTDRNALSQVFYGTTPGLGSSSPLDPSAVFTHNVTLSGLTPGQLYYFDVESEDLNGNVARDDNGGQHYTFSVPVPGDLLLVYGGDAFERPTYYTASLTELGWAWDTWSGTQSESPLLGDLNSGLRSYKAVWWQPGLDLYPPVSDSARSAITAYLDGGGRLAINGHDIGWALADPTSPYFSAARQAWLQSTLRTIFNADPAGWTSVAGIAADPISAPYTGGLSYTEHRSGASGDEIDPTGGSVADWRSGDGTPDDAGVRWDSGGPLGTPGSGVWGGAPTRLAATYFEWTGVDPSSFPSSSLRREIMRRTLVWLLGRDKPTVTITSPNGGEVVTAGPLSITWTESTDGGTSVGSRLIQYSINGGTSWITITPSAGPSPYSWDLTGVPNSSTVVVRVTVNDDGSPSLKGFDVNDATFTINRPGGDALGPKVIAGSIVSSPNPIDNTQPATLTATVSDSTSGGSNIAAAEWSFGTNPAAAGAGTPMSGTFTSPQVAVSAALATGPFPPGNGRLWVRGRDAIGNWGAASKLDLVVNGNSLVGVEGGPATRLELRQNAPNPVLASTTIAYGLPAETGVRLAIYDVSGRHVRDLVNRSVGAGMHSVSWDRTDDRGRAVGPGVYYYRMEVGATRFVKRLVVLQ
jgi:hypothetical protein